MMMEEMFYELDKRYPDALVLNVQFEGGLIMDYSVMQPGDNYFTQTFVELDDEMQEIIEAACYEVIDQSSEGEVLGSVVFDLLTQTFSTTYTTRQHQEWDHVIGCY